ncbi:MAG TPA: M23 family metallopeptidase [Xanthobacteraceae bacterium]|nr:M23 family metallopeptidase [Xanthobacteraceae bacterium]
MSYRGSSQAREADHFFRQGRERTDFGRRAAADPAFPAGKRDYTLAHGGRQFRLGPLAFWTTALILLIMALWSAGTATYFAFRDDLLTRLIARQADMQYAYEDRIAELRAQVDRLTSRQLLDQEQVERRIELLAQRQGMLESRGSVLSTLPDQAPTGLIKPKPSLRLESTGDTAAKSSPINDTVILAPPSERHSSLQSRLLAPRARKSAEPKQSIAATLAAIEESLDRVAAQQSAALSAIEDRYDGKARRMRRVLVELGIDITKIAAASAPSGLGGPLIPVAIHADSGAFERQLHRIELARAQVERLGRTLNSVPVRRPLAGEIDTSSGFGVRLDPFIRAPAMHSGLDFRAAHGEPVRATATGKVVSAGWNGGYGRMIEIDHGNGLSTRYAHLSEILVKEDQLIRPGQIIGRVGSTGRSTGPHLHYETRIDGEAVDPHKFLRAGLRLSDRL